MDAQRRREARIPILIINPPLLKVVYLRLESAPRPPKNNSPHSSPASISARDSETPIKALIENSLPFSLQISLKERGVDFYLDCCFFFGGRGPEFYSGIDYLIKGVGWL